VVGAPEQPHVFESVSHLECRQNVIVVFDLWQESEKTHSCCLTVLRKSLIPVKGPVMSGPTQTLRWLHQRAVAIGRRDKKLQQDVFSFLMCSAWHAWTINLIRKVREERVRLRALSGTV
jgi:hypothetical protein